jgi:hypothetical protein
LTAVARRRPKTSKPNATGRNDTDRFARLSHRMLHSPAHCALSPNARSLLVVLTSMDNDRNNGSLFLRIRDAACRMGVADLKAASNGFDELQDLGFIEMTQDAHYSVKASETSRARCWRLTWRPGPGRKAPTSDYLVRQPEPGTKPHKRMERGLRALKNYRKGRSLGKFPVLDSDTLDSLRAELPAIPVLESHTPNFNNGGFAPTTVVLDSVTHTAATMGNDTQSRGSGPQLGTDDPYAMLQPYAAPSALFPCGTLAAGATNRSSGTAWAALSMWLTRRRHLAANR